MTVQVVIGLTVSPPSLSIVKLVRSLNDYHQFGDMQQRDWEISHCEYAHPSLHRTCESASSVEHFFNVIFSEFQSLPPVCVCVQMCPDQPTYCYPNNCFKPVNKRKNDRTNPISKIEGHKTQPVMFLVDHDKDLLDIFDEHELHVPKGRTERPVNEFILRPNPFKEFVLKYKRLPKLEMRYNLREQVKNTKSDKLKGDSINLSKTRWPLNKQVFHTKQSRSEIKHFKGNDDARQTKFFTSMFTEHEPVNYTPKYLKKYLTKRENGDVNLEALYLYKTDSANFSLETLIDNMIKGGLDKNTNSDGLNLNEYTNNSSDLTTSTRKVLRNVERNNYLNDAKTHEDSKVELNVVSLNSTNETIDKNIYIEYFNATDIVNRSVVEMIENMSNEIDKQNNISKEIVEKKIGNKVHVYDIPQLGIDIKEDVFNNEVAKRNSEADNVTTNHVDLNTFDKQEMFTTTYTSVPIVMKIMKEKSKQRIVRKLRNKKHV